MGHPAATAPLTQAAAADAGPPSGQAPRYRAPAPMDDQNIVAAIAAHNIAGVLAAFDRYAGELYAYCQSRLTEPADAAAAIKDTFVTASAKVSELPDPTLRRAWLFAVARNECHRRLRATAPSAPLYESAEAMDNTGQFSAVAVQPAVSEQKELRALVRAALAELDPEDREVSELNLRYGLSRSELGAVLGVPRNQAQALAARASARFERSLGVALVTGSERQYCPELAAIMDGSAHSPAVLLRRQVKRHSEYCAVCSELKRRDLGPAMLLSMLTVPNLPVGLRRRIFDLVTDPSADAAAYRSHVTNQAEPFGVNGFPVQLAPPSAARWHSILVMAAVLGAVALALLGGGMYFVDYTSSHSEPTAPSPSATTASASTSAAVPSTHPNARASDSTPSATALIPPAAPGQSVAPTKVARTSAAPTKKASPAPTSPTAPPTSAPTSPTAPPTSAPTSPTAPPTSGTSSSAPSIGTSSAASIALTLPGITSGLVSVG